MRKSVIGTMTAVALLMAGPNWQLRPAVAMGSVSACALGMALGGYLGHRYHHSIAGVMGGCSMGILANSMYQHYKVDHPSVSFWDYVKQNKDALAAKFGYGSAYLSGNN